tara:strand:- start:20015 stop:20923 length:909 start_codon:yes stop_codon:yes gene_type:complete
MFKTFSKTISKVLIYFITILSDKIHKFFWRSKSNFQKNSLQLIDIELFLKRLNIKKGDTLFVHSSWKELRQANFTAKELLEFLIKYLGQEGTLCMPAFPASQSKITEFNVKHTPSAAGLLTEIFRRYPGVKRSVNLNHSVVALGKHAEFLVDEHHLSLTACDERSPYFKLSKIKNAWIVGFGVGHRLKIATALHCVESQLWKTIPYFKKVFREQRCYNYIDKNGIRGEHCYFVRRGAIYTPRLAKYFTEQELIEYEIKGLQLYAIKAPILINKAVELGKRGKTMYIWPLPFPWLFKENIDSA